MPPRWLPPLLTQIRQLVEQGRVRFTYKAVRELTRLGVGLDEDDACDILAGLRQLDFNHRLVSEHTGEWMYVRRGA